MRRERVTLDSQSLHILKQTVQHFNHKRKQAFLVGGSLRNLLLGEPTIDWDIITDGDAHRLARGLADKLGGHYAHMNEKASRVVFKQDTGEIVLDVSPLNGNTIENDLRRRDFTINAMAVPLGDAVRYLEQFAVARPQGPPDRSMVGATLAVALPSDSDALTPVALPSDSDALTPVALPPATVPPVALPSDALTPVALPPAASPLLNDVPTSSNVELPPALPPVALPADTLRTSLIDPLGGLPDINARRLRAVDNNIFKHDPLRMLRAVRLMMRYGLSIDTGTEQLLKRDAELLRNVAAERVHDELYAILEPEGASGRLRFLDEHGLFTVIFPEFIPARGMRQPYPHYWDVLEHSLEAVGALERLARMLQGEKEQGERPAGGAVLMRPANAAPSRLLLRSQAGREASSPTPQPQPLPPLLDIRTLLHEAEEQGIFSFGALESPRVKLAALLHDIGKTVTYATDEEGHIHFYYHPQAGVPLAQEIMKRLRASTQDRRFIQQVVAHHMRPGQLGQDGPVTPRATRRYFADLGPVGIYVSLISLADHLATLGPQPPGEAWERHLGVVRLLLTRYIRERESILPPRLISAEELMRRLRLEPGPQVGQLLELLAEAQAEGRIHSKEEAVWLAEEKLQTGEIPYGHS